MTTRFAELHTALVTLADALEPRVDPLLERGLARMRDEIPDFFTRDGDPDFVATYRTSCAQQMRFMIERLGGERTLDGDAPPALAVEEARMSAARSIPLAAIVQGYRITHRLLLEETLGVAEVAIADESLRAAALKETSRWFFAYIDWVLPAVSEAYERERARLVRRREDRRRQLVDDILGERPVDASALGYDLAVPHVGVIAWGERTDEALAAVRRAAAGSALLSVAGTETTRWGWVGGAAVHELDPAAIALPDRTSVALGAPALGVDGFRRTHREAWAAYRIARRTDERVTRYDDVALLALALQDPLAARDFAVRELGPLAEGGRRATVLRDTLAAYFAAGQNAAEAAVALGVHHRTVLYRLKSIEQQLGRRVDARREELGVALRLAPLVV